MGESLSRDGYARRAMKLTTRPRRVQTRHRHHQALVALGLQKHSSIVAVLRRFDDQLVRRKGEHLALDIDRGNQQSLGAGADLHSRMRDRDIRILDLRPEANGPGLVQLKAQILRSVAAAPPEHNLRLRRARFRLPRPLPAPRQEGAAGDSLSQSAAAAQDKFAAVEGDVEARIKKNPSGAVAVGRLIGLLIGKMS